MPNDLVFDERTLAATMRRINQACLAGSARDIAAWIDPNIVMVFPGSPGGISGQEAFIGGVEDFVQSVKIHEMREGEYTTLVVGHAGFISFPYEMVYERYGRRRRARGRDVWVFIAHDRAWRAVWRTVLKVSESEA